MSTFVEVLRRLLQDPSLTTKNNLFDPALQSFYVDRVNAITQDLVQYVSAADATDSAGSLAADVRNNVIKLDTSEFEMRLSKFRDGLQSTPRKVRRRVPGSATFVTPADRVRYVLADPTDGVLLLDHSLEIVRTFPGFTAGIVGGNLYGAAQGAQTFTIADTEYIAIACGINHVVRIYDFVTGALVSTIGTLASEGVPTAVPDPLLGTPVSVTVDEVGARLFVVCASDGPNGDTGYVAEFSIAVVAAPVFTQYVVAGDTFTRLNNGECLAPSDAFFVPVDGARPARLWIANGIGDVAAFQEATGWFPSLVIEAQGRTYTLGADTLTVPQGVSTNAIDVFDTEAGAQLFVACSNTAQVEVFSAETATFGQHLASYGQRGLETTMPYGAPLRVYSTPREPKLTFGVFASATGVACDTRGDQTVLVVADASAGRLQQLQLSVFNEDNMVTFKEASFKVASNIQGWFLPSGSTFPPDFLTLEVRDPGDATATPVIPAGQWRVVPQAGLAATVRGPAMTRYQLRVSAKIPQGAKIESYELPAVGILWSQQW